MKKIAPIGLLALLLYNTFGLTFAVLFFEKDFKVASLTDGKEDWKVMKMYLPSLPYSDNVEISDNIEGLVRQDGNFYNPTHILHENDTLYVTLKSNQAARDHFFELANAMEMLSNPETDFPNNPYSKAIKLLGNLLKNYVPSTFEFDIPKTCFSDQRSEFNNLPVKRVYASIDIRLPTPPPEFC
ncbi:hypothetical protein FEM33_03565 [Dyadobacter flavalbus]|uniref:Uncharacterized protein n=1 Tax=Dyadobacter flavalbus TaxID=2579942 RepID=A0A5M8R1M5_9BACT|nr:hypothetical protein [Dyadobacter flavalbus]KAA6441210.1 hypothetical protein FEM33_03565 [Dyadobacter flavalbus]